MQYWFFRYLGPVPLPWVMEPVYDLQQSHYSNPDTRPLYDDVPLQSVARSWVPLGVLLDPRAPSHTYLGMRPFSKGPANSLAQAVAEVVRPGPLPGRYETQDDSIVGPHRDFLRQNPGALGLASAWPTQVGDPSWAPAQALEARWHDYLFRSHLVRYEYIDLPKECSYALYDQEAPDGPNPTREEMAAQARTAASRNFPDQHVDAIQRLMPLAVPAEPVHGSPPLSRRPRGMDTMDQVQQLWRVQQCSAPGPVDRGATSSARRAPRADRPGAGTRTGRPNRAARQ